MNAESQEINGRIWFGFLYLYLENDNLVSKPIMREFFDIQMRENLKEYALGSRVENINDRLELFRKDVSRVNSII